MVEVAVGLVGVGGFGSKYVELLLQEADSHGVRFIGAVDPLPESSPCLSILREKQIPIYSSLSAFYTYERASLMILSSPIHYHAEQGCLAMEQGSHVLCEKPLCATIQEAEELIEVRNRTGRIFAVGFQWAYDPVFRQLKRDILEGNLGKPKKLLSLVLWPRNTQYFSRSWAGKLKSKDGKWILDSIANNAAAHFLHAMLHLLGPEETFSAFPRWVKAELYRANSIETFDTIAMRLLTDEEVEVCFYASHAVLVEKGPIFRFEFDRGTVFYNDPLVPESRRMLVFRDRNGRFIYYGNPTHQSMEKVWRVVESIDGSASNLCPIESALSHTSCIEAVHGSGVEAVPFPSNLLRRSGDPEIIWVEGLEDSFLLCYRKGVLPSELRVPWVHFGTEIFIPKNR
ncbi:MAG: Gfo/Idh/MocA family oxidoreductase [Spirochaetes bacterium]|nr:Gfo/Idh/MocA family oxidoreductase [Spirochaetota bacterium]